VFFRGFGSVGVYEAIDSLQHIAGLGRDSSLREGGVLGGDAWGWCPLERGSGPCLLRQPVAEGVIAEEGHDPDFAVETL